MIELPGIGSLKEKRSIVVPLKEKLQNRYKLSVAEVDMQDSLQFAIIGAAYVSNSRQFGESVLQKALAFVENELAARVVDSKISSEFY